MKKLVYICSPCRGDYEKNLDEARAYCKVIMDCYPDVIPIAPHLYFTQFLRDNIARERSLGMQAGLALLDMSDEIWVFGLDNPSEGMRMEIEYAHKNEIPLRSGEFIKKIIDKVPPVFTDKLGDAVVWLPQQNDDYGDVEVVKGTGMRLSGELVLDMAQKLKRNRGQDVEVTVRAAK
jgi:hypothetical protein